MLFEFLGQYKKEIIQLCREKVLADGDSKPTSALLDQGLPVFYDELIGVLRRTASAADSRSDSEIFLSKNRIREGDAAAHGKESLRLGYTISQVVHAYGAVCQSITEFVQIKSYKVTTREFQDLNLSLDCAIAEAVTEFEKVQSENVTHNEVERLGFLLHEMGNCLAAATIAQEMIREGQVGSKGITSQVLSRAHERMGHLINSARVEVRLREHASVVKTQIRLMDILSEVEAAAILMKKSKAVHLELDVDPSIHLTADRDLIFSALLNLVNNAIKFTKKGGHVSVRSKESGGRILIEVEDECGGLPEGKTEELFKSFIQRGADKSGMGLGLSISRQAIELNRGKLTVSNLPGKGCVFMIDLPKSEALKLPLPQLAAL